MEEVAGQINEGAYRSCPIPQLFCRMGVCHRATGADSSFIGFSHNDASGH
jgi:hypothetical protein